MDKKTKNKRFYKFLNSLNDNSLLEVYLEYIFKEIDQFNITIIGMYDRDNRKLFQIWNKNSKFVLLGTSEQDSVIFMYPKLKKKRYITNLKSGGSFTVSSMVIKKDVVEIIKYLKSD